MAGPVAVPPRLLFGCESVGLGGGVLGGGGLFGPGGVLGRLAGQQGGQAGVFVPAVAVDGVADPERDGGGSGAGEL